MAWTPAPPVIAIRMDRAVRASHSAANLPAHAARAALARPVVIAVPPARAHMVIAAPAALAPMLIAARAMARGATVVHGAKAAMVQVRAKVVHHVRPNPTDILAMRRTFRPIMPTRVASTRMATAPAATGPPAGLDKDRVHPVHVQAVHARVAHAQAAIATRAVAAATRAAIAELTGKGVIGALVSLAEPQRPAPFDPCNDEAYRCGW